MQTPNTADQAASSRDALSRAIFGAIFSYLVGRINERLGGGGTWGGSESGVSGLGDEGGTVGVLDIFGFEIFVLNSFEQLCINYANEKLQAHFNSEVFGVEQREYEAEGIAWERQEHSSNEGTVSLLEGRMGVLQFLVEQTRLPNGDDRVFCSAVRSIKHPSLIAPPGRPSAFGVAHYAGRVQYESEGFVHRNKDILADSLRLLLCSSASAFVSSLLAAGPSAQDAQERAKEPRRASRSEGGGASLAAQFKSQLNSLLQRISLGR